MSFIAELKIGNNIWDVIYCKYAFKQEVDYKGMPITKPLGGIFHLVIESTADTSLLEGMLGMEEKSYDGRLSFKETTEDADMKTIEFEKGYVIEYEEVFDKFNKQPMQITLKITCETFKIGALSHFRSWDQRMS